MCGSAGSSLFHSSKLAVCTAGDTKPMPLDVQEEGGREGGREGGGCTEIRVYRNKSARKNEIDIDNNVNLCYLTNRPRRRF